MTELSLFDARGNFCPLADADIDALSDTRRAVYMKISRAAGDLKVADSAVVLAIENVRACADAVTEFENFMRKSFPKMTFHDLWKQTVKGI